MGWAVIGIAFFISTFLPWRLAPWITWFVFFILFLLHAKIKAWAAIPTKEERYAIEKPDDFS